MKSHKQAHNCRCDICKKGADAVLSAQMESIDRYGWFVHYVYDDKMCPYKVNVHTHHVEESFGHKDIQICINLKPELIHMLLVNVINNIKAGVKYEPGKKYEKIVDNFKLEFIEVTESGRKVLRLLIPDEKGNYDGLYAEQLTKLNNADVHPILLN
jgi:hypothetical protein